MSLFLGPIHHWLYNKIQLQEQLTQTLAAVDPERKETVLAHVDAACGQAEMRPLEEVIDTQNIHGWLQSQVAIVEARFAETVTEILQEAPEQMKALEEAAFSFGQKTPLENAKDPTSAYESLNDVLLDGMPCDRVNDMREQTLDRLSWERVEDLHRAFWVNAGGNPEHFDIIRSAWIRGMLDGSDLSYHKRGSRLFIQKEAA